MKIEIAKILKVIKDEDNGDDYDDYFEVEVSEDITLYLTNDVSYSATVKTINNDNIVVEDEEGREIVVPFDKIEDIEI